MSSIKRLYTVLSQTSFNQFFLKSYPPFTQNVYLRTMHKSWSKNNPIKIFIGGLLLGILMFSFIENGPVPPLSFNSQKQTVKVVSEESATVGSVKKIGPSVVTIVGTSTQNSKRILDFGPFFFSYPKGNSSQNPKDQTIASGFIVSLNGLVATNKHVVSDSTMNYQVITFDNKKFDVTNVYQDPSNDVAIIKINPSQNPGTKLIPAQLGDSSSLEAGQFIVAIGTALGQFRNSVTTGVISGLGRGITAGDISNNGPSENLTNLIQISAAVNPGNSGGPLVDANEEVVGMNTAIAADGQNIGFALPINVVKNFLKTLTFNF